MNNTIWLLLFGNKNVRPVDRFDYILIKIVLGTVYFTLFLIIAFAVLLFFIF